MLKLTDKITFGKHKGRTVSEVIENDAAYIEWAQVFRLMRRRKRSSLTLWMTSTHQNIISTRILGTNRCGAEHAAVHLLERYR